MLDVYAEVGEDSPWDEQVAAGELGLFPNNTMRSSQPGGITSDGDQIMRASRRLAVAFSHSGIFHRDGNRGGEC